MNCIFVNCDRSVLAKGLCHGHYQQQYRGTVLREIRTDRWHGKHPLKLYQCWSDMKQRCYNPNIISYKDYGARGIVVSEEWQKSFSVFREWAFQNGYQEGLSINRTNNDGPYSPENCSWSTSRQQAVNRRTTKFITAFGETKAMADWLEDQRCCVKKSTLRSRLNRGVDPETAMILVPEKGTRLASRIKDRTILGEV